MSKFVLFEAKGFRKVKDRKGNVRQQIVRCRGIVREDAESIGNVHRQYPKLIPCQEISIEFYDLC